MTDLAKIAERNLRTYLSGAPFRNEVDREAAMNCLEVLSESLTNLHAALYRIVENSDIRDAMSKGELSQARAALASPSEKWPPPNQSPVPTETTGE